MGNSYAGQLRTTRFEEVLHNSIEASLRSSSVIPRPVFSQLYLEAEQHASSQDAGRQDNEEEEEEEESSESNSPPIPYQMKPPPEGCCTTDGFCQSGKDLRLASIANDPLEVPPGFLLVGAKCPSLPDHILVCAVDRRFLPDESGRNALLGFSGNCVGCGEKGFRYFTEFSNHINLKLTTQPKKQKHLKYRLFRSPQGTLVKGPLICWKGIDGRVKQMASNTCASHITSEELLPTPAAMEMLSGIGHVAPTTGNSTAGVPADVPAPAYPQGAPPTQPSSRDCPLSQQPRHPPGKPPMTGTIANTGPPKKRHKGWSPELRPATEPAVKTTSSASALNNKLDNSAPLCASQGCSPLPPPEGAVTVPDNLLQTCGVQPIILKGHGSLPPLCGNVCEVTVSPLLEACYRSAQTLPRVYEQYGASPIQPLSAEMQILLTVYYLVQLAPDQVPLIEDLEQIFMRSWRESHLTEIRQYQQGHGQPPPTLPSPAQPLTASQLPWLAKLAASSCGEGVLVLDTAGSLTEGLEDTFLCLQEGKLAQTNYVVIICLPRGHDIESCVVVTGKQQARALAESMHTPADSLKEIARQLATGKVAELDTFFSSLGPDGNVDALLEESSLEGNSHSSLSSILQSSGESLKGACTEYRVEWHEIRPIQLAVARKLLSHLCAIADSSTQNLDLGSFDKVDFLILVPPSEVTFQQIALHLWSSGVLQELGLDAKGTSHIEAEQRVVRLNREAQGRINTLIHNSRINPSTLFILVHDHAHWDLSRGPYAGGDSCSGLVDSLLNCQGIWEAPNIVTLHVTSFPFALQTQSTRISPYNEVHWPSSFSNDVDLYQEKTKYFGMSEFLESTRSGSGLPLLRYDSLFESMASALGERFPKLHSSVIRTYVLIQHYTLALMVLSGRSRLQKHTSAETLELVRDLLDSSRGCSGHHGHMVLLRVPSLSLASLAHQRLRRVRDSLGLQDRFEIVLGSPGSGLSVSRHFLEQLKTWLNIQDSNWTPRTYLELEALPCILIFSGMDPLGESLPRSLKYCDLRLISPSHLLRTTLEQELGLAAYLVRAEAQGGRPPVSDLSESDPEKLSSTDNEEEELVGNRSADPPGLDRSVPSAGLLTLPDSSIVDHEQQGVRQTPGSSVIVSGDPAQCKRRPSSSTQASSHSSPGRRCPWAHSRNRPPVVLLPRVAYEALTSVDSSGLPKSTSFLPHPYVEWASSFRPLLSKMMTCTEQSLYYRQWTIPGPQHMDSSNRAEGRAENFHPRRLLLSGPPQVGKTGAYLRFLGILSRMLIRLMEVDVYDEDDINLSVPVKPVQYHQPGVSWPNIDILKAMPFDYTVHDPKFEDISTVYSPDFTSAGDGIVRRQDEVYLRRRTSRIKLSKYAAYNTYHHCEQCHQYMGFSPRYQLYESTLHTFTFSHLLLGEEIQLYFIIPKSKEHHFAFSHPGGQLESMRLPLTSDWNPNSIKSPIFTPTTGRHEHGLFNLYHAMDGATHLHILVIKEYELSVYKKYWPNHIMLVLPSIFNGAGIGAAHFLIKELSYHNLELERSRQVEQGSRPQDVWPFIVLADDSCVMWNSVEVDPRRCGFPSARFLCGGAVTEKNVSLKQVLQHMESSPDITRYGLCGLRKWSSRGVGPGRPREPFSRGHLHDFLLLNVDLTQDVQFNQNRFLCDGVDFNLRVHSAGILIFRFNNFSVMKKQIAIGGHRTFLIKTKVSDIPTSLPPSQYVCAPDSKHTFLAAPAQLLLEKYLQHTSQHLFPLSVRNYSHPVLSVDCYLNLGPEVTVCFISSRPHSVNISTTGLLFGGLLLYFCDSFVTPSFLKKFQFLKGATLCVICPDRSSLRQTVARLELEDEWRFRLRDEFQTANAKEDRPIFFLTGKHV
ncbi:protein GREB1 isoform X3 [Scleropages formosus]|uniref:protein GREB1 isoform X3 n=1 Tax=Scleropages formosus TaxID=113540 RepID=UPI0010FAC86E|nr:protein GREB1 isoform X3 [Scleropages formosus]